jgi:hypothetical protein
VGGGGGGGASPIPPPPPPPPPQNSPHPSAICSRHGLHHHHHHHHRSIEAIDRSTDRSIDQIAAADWVASQIQPTSPPCLCFNPTPLALVCGPKSTPAPATKATPPQNHRPPPFQPGTHAHGLTCIGRGVPLGQGGGGRWWWSYGAQPPVPSVPTERPPACLLCPWWDAVACLLPPSATARSNSSLARLLSLLYFGR